MEPEFASALARCWDHCLTGEIRVALTEGLTIRQAAAAQGDDAGAAAASSMIGWFCFQAGEVEIGIEHAYAAKSFWAERGDTTREVWAGAVYAWLLLEAGLTEEAADEALKALALAEPAADPVALSWALNVLGVIFWSCKQLERAQVLCERAVEIARTSGDLNLLGWWLINEAGVQSEIAYRQQARDDVRAPATLKRALAINQEALDLARCIGDDWGRRIALANAAEYLIALGDLAGAAGSLDEWEALPGERNRRAVIHLLYTKGQLLTKQGRWDDAVAVCTQALALARESHHAESEAHALRSLSEIYEGMGRFDTSLAYFKRFHDAQLRLAEEKIQRRARFAEIHYETERFKRLAESASARADQMAITTMLDPLTGIGNRRGLDRAFEDRRAGRARFAIAVIDLDHFKRINDTYSHAVGDAVLKRVASTLQGAMRTGDIVVRLGGEEFVVLMRDVTIAEATASCARLNRQIAAVGWDDVASGLRVTASIGVAVDDDERDPAILLEVADRRLYAAKAAGRDRVVGESDCAPSMADCQISNLTMFASLASMEGELTVP